RAPRSGKNESVRLSRIDIRPGEWRIPSMKQTLAVAVLVAALAVLFKLAFKPAGPADARDKGNAGLATG
ncbi:MAG: hypothetical protein ACLQVD_18210, partial [Capsulimonadaceae bacterium]